MAHGTITLTTPASPRTDIDAAVEAGRVAAGPAELYPGATYVFHTPQGVEVVDLDTDEHRRRTTGRPERKTGTVVLDDADSFAAYVGDHGEPARTHLFASRDRLEVLALLNGHRRGHHDPDAETEEDPGGWGDHRARLALRHTAEWKRWTGASGVWMRQEAFAEFIEDGAPEIRDPDAAAMLELASTIEATKGAEMKSSVRLDNGQVRVRYEETVKTKAGAAGQLDYPTRLVLGIAPFEGAETYRVDARLRHRIADGGLALAFVLERPDDVIRSAFGDVTKAIGEATGLDVLHGRP